MSSSSNEDLNWSAPAGRLLKKFIAGLPKDRPFVLNLFGSSPLQLKLDGSFLSGDVDVFSDQNLEEFVSAQGLGKGQSSPFIEVVPAHTFIASPLWRQRADCVVLGQVTLYIASPLDVLVGKVKRLERKDLDAFELVKAKTGGPSEDVLKAALRDVVDMYRPAFDEEAAGGDAKANTRRLWQTIFGRDIDVQTEIIGPALEARRKAYGRNAPDVLETLKKAI
jgi:hypothetical protein